jgi:hypothetical protein
VTIRILLTTVLLLLLLALPGGRDWERSRPSAREKRIAGAERRELVRSALRSAAARGYYVFDELMTEEAGMIDFLAVGPVGTCVIVVRDEEGNVTADVDGTLYLDGRHFEDDPNRQAEDLVDDVNAKLADTGAHAYHVICFTRADLYYLGEDREVLRGVCPTWDLALAFAEATEEYSPADVAELAEEVERAYGRPPFVRPAGTGP